MLGKSNDNSDGNAKVALGASINKSPVNPLSKKINLNFSNRSPTPPPPDNSNRTGCSISNGTYLNVNVAKK